MQNVKQAARQVNPENIPAGQSQYQPRPKHPFLTATWEQFRHPSDGRKFESRCKLKREICRGYAKLGADATRTMLSRFLHLPEHTVIRGQRYACQSGFVEHIERVPGRRHRHGYFASDRMMRALHPERLRPRIESAYTVPAESAYNKASGSKSKASKAEARAGTAPASAPKASEPKPQSETAITPSGFDRIRRAFAAIQLKPMGSMKCQSLWTCTYEQDGATADAMESFFDAANAQHIPIPPPMFAAKHRLEQIEKEDSRLASHIEARFGKDALAVVQRGCAESGTHISQDSRIGELFQRAKQAEAAKQEQQRQQAAAFAAQRIQTFNAAFLKSQQDFGTTREQVLSWLRVEFRTVSLADLNENQFAHLLRELNNAWWWNRTLWSQSA